MRRRQMARRRLLALGLGGVAGFGVGSKILIGGLKAMAASNPETMVYVSNAGSREVFVLAMNRASGALDLIEKTPVPGSDKSPASLPMTTSRDKRFLYAQLRGAPFPVSTFAIERPSGKLRLVAETPLVDQMAYINTDRSGKFLLCASYVGAKLAIYPINKSTGIPEPKATQILGTKPKAHCVYVGAGDNLYVPVLGGDEVLELKLDTATGTVSPNGPGEVRTKVGAGPRHFTIHPNGRWAYLITETTATVGTYNVDPATGQLTEVGFVDTGDYNGKDSAAASDIHVTPNGKFLYGAVRTTSTLHGYKIDPDKGTLTPIGTWPTEKTPRGFNIDPRGRFLLSVGMDSNAMTVHAINPAAGVLNPVGHYPMGTQPNWIEIVDLR